MSTINRSSSSSLGVPKVGAKALSNASDATNRASSTNSTATTPKPAEKPPLVTLGDYLESNGNKVEDLQDNKWKLNSAARALLKAGGVDSPTTSQIDDVVAKISEAINVGKWQSFTADVKPVLLKREDNINQRLGNIFGEKKIYSESQLTAKNLTMTNSVRSRLEGDFESGRSGMIMAASFVSTHGRAEGDFTRAYGDEAWRGFMRAHNALNAIPRGEFLQKLDVNLVRDTNRLIHAPDKGFTAMLLRGIAAIGRGGHWDKGGKLREGRQFARPQHYSEAQLKNIEEAGITVMRLASTEQGSYAMLEYPKPDQVEHRLQEILYTLRDDLRQEDADPIAAAAKFQRSFVALHPFGDSNGRTSRLLMNRILNEFDLPPAILDRQNHDIDLSPKQWRREVAEGVARSTDFLRLNTVRSKDNYLARMGISAIEKSPDKPVQIDGSSFDLGRDGLLYDPTGRPWMAFGDELVPMSQLDHYVFSRRIMMLEKGAAKAKLGEITQATQALYNKISADPETGKKISVRPDTAQRQADMDYKLLPQPEIAALLVELSDVDKIDPAQIFTVKRANGTDQSSAMSKYSQLDLELWYLQRGLKDSDQPKLAKQVRAQRSKLFDLAKARLQTAGKDENKTETNPLGFTKKYEKLMYDQSPLRFASLKEAVKAEGDDSMIVWRGDYGFAKLIGMAPNNDVRQPDARAVAKARADQGQITNIYDDLTKLEGSAIGRQYICTTSDLALLSQSFASKTKSQKINLSTLPDFISDHILAWIDPEKDAKEADKASDPDAVDKAKTDDARSKEAEADKDPPGTKVIKDKFGVPGSLFKLLVKEKNSKKIEVEASRKAFLMRMDKEALLPGIVALGGPSFENEQEIHGLERVYPWNIKGVWDAKDLNTPWPPLEAKPEDPPAATTTRAHADDAAVG